MARQPSIQREMTAPPASWARKRAGTAKRPLSSTVCRYSPVNTLGPYPSSADQRRARGDRGLGIGVAGFRSALPEDRWRVEMGSVDGDRVPHYYPLLSTCADHSELRQLVNTRLAGF